MRAALEGEPDRARRLALRTALSELEQRIALRLEALRKNATL